MKKISAIIFFLLLGLGNSFSQNDFHIPKNESTKIKFQLLDNLIILPVELNGISLSFLLDTGVSRTILFNIVDSAQDLKLKDVEVIKLRGLGDEGYVDALKSSKNRLKIGQALSSNQEVFVIADESINFTPRLGIPVHGIVGYDLFKDFVVEINYGAGYIRLTPSESYHYKKCKKCESLNLTFHTYKPFIDALVSYRGNDISVRLLMDTGGSDALWLFENKELELLPEEGKYFEDFLGKGLSGSVHGKRAKINEFSIKGFHLPNVNVAFPDSSAVSIARNYQERSGSMGGELLKRFNMIFDYKRARVSFRKNKYFKQPFEYNKSGIVLEQEGERIVKVKVENKPSKNYGKEDDGFRIDMVENFKFQLKPSFKIVELVPGSAAATAGLMVGDVLISVNNKSVDQMKLQEVNTFFRGRAGQKIRLGIDRNGVLMRFDFKLQKLW